MLAIEVDTPATPVVVRLTVITSPAATVKECVVSLELVVVVCVIAATVNVVSTPFFLTTIEVAGVLTLAVVPVRT